MTADFHKKIMRQISIKTISKIIIHQTEFSMNLAFLFLHVLAGLVSRLNISKQNDQNTDQRRLSRDHMKRDITCNDIT